MVKYDVLPSGRTGEKGDRGSKGNSGLQGIYVFVLHDILFLTAMSPF